MHPKSLKVTFTVDAETIEAAIADLAGRFLRPTKTGCRVVRQPTEFPLNELCKSLIEDWQSGKVAYSKGDISLVFSSGEVGPEADLTVYAPELGDRFLYSKRIDPSTPAPTSSPSAHVPNPDLLTQQLHTTAETLEALAANQRAVEARMQELLGQQLTPSVLEQALKLQADAFSRQLEAALDAQATKFAQILSNQLTSTALHFSERINAIQAQLNELTARMAELGEVGSSEDTRVPQTEAEWLQRFQETWGTVGDYEQYNSSYRDANAETPLFYTPDWVALCELDWARKLSPTLATLYALIHDEKGIGQAGADILQQFGCHIDPHTGDRYYIYQQGNFTAFEALRQIVNNPHYSWLPELKRLWLRLRDRHRDIFQLFGWEAEAIAALESLVERSYQERQSTYDAWNYKKTGADTLSDYLALLNLGPFTPITIESIKRAYRLAMKVAHPDAGGSKEHAQKINEAYEAVLAHYFPDAT